MAFAGILIPALFGTQDIPPLRQTFDEMIREFEYGIILKMESDNGKIIGSVRANHQLYWSRHSR